MLVLRGTKMSYSDQGLGLFCEINGITENMYDRVLRYVWAFMNSNESEDEGIHFHDAWAHAEFVHDLTRMICREHAQELEHMFTCILEDEYDEILATMPWDFIEHFQALLCFEVIEKVNPQCALSKHIEAMKEIGGAEYTYRNIKMVYEIVTVNSPIINAYYVGRCNGI
jgi:hypothetical protein